MSEPSLLDYIQSEGSDDSSAATDAKSTDVSESTVGTITEPTAGNPVDETENDTSDADNGSDDNAGDTALDDYLASYKELTGKDLDGDYDDVDAAREAVTQLTSSDPAQSEAATNWQNLLEISQDDPKVMNALRLALSGETPAPAKESDKTDDSGNGMPKSMEELRLWQSKIAGENPDPEYVKKVSTYLDRVNQQLFDDVSNPTKRFEPMAAKLKQDILDEIRGESQQHAAAQQARGHFDALLETHAEKLYVDGDRSKLTDYGKQVNKELQDLTEGEGAMAPGARALQKAIDIASSSLASPQKTRKPSSRAGRKPAVNPAPDQGFDEQKFFDNGGGLAELLELKMKRKDSN